MWYYDCIWHILTLNSGAHSHFCQLCLHHVIWGGALVGSRASTPLKISVVAHISWDVMYVTWAHVILRVQLGYFNFEFWRTLTLLSFCLRHVIWRGVLFGWRASTPLKISVVGHISWDVSSALQLCYQLFPEMEEMLIEKLRKRTFQYDIKCAPTEI
jgi:hypothetical protein